MSGRGVGGVRRDCVWEDQVAWQCEGEVKGVKTIRITTWTPHLVQAVTGRLRFGCLHLVKVASFYQPTAEIQLYSGWYN